MPSRTPADAYQWLFENNMDAVLLTIPDGTIVAANPSACAMFGMTEDELCATGRDRIIDITDSRLSAYLEERKRLGKARGELTYKRKDGSTFFGETASVIVDHGKRAFVIIRDMTAQKRAEEALRESEEHARRIIDNTVALVGVLTPDGTLIEANAKALRSGGLRREEVIGKKFWDCYWWNHDVSVQEQLREAVAKAKSGEVVRYDVVVRVAGDGRMPIDFMLAPSRNSAGRITHLIPSGIDIADRKRTEEELRGSEAKFRAVFEQAAIGMARVSFTDARPIDVNSAFCRMLGYSLEEMRATPWMQITHPDDLELDLIPFHRMAAGELDSYTVEKRYIDNNGHLIWAHLTLSLVRDAQGRPDYQIAVIENITERKRVEKELLEAKAAAEEASSAKSEFLANMSHEIRTPMTVFMAAIEHLLEIDQNPERRKLLGMAEQSAERLRSLIDDILDFSRIEARKVDIEEEIFDFRACVRKVVGMFALAAREKNLLLETEISGTIPDFVTGDPDRIGQILTNLIGNAVKFTHEGEVRVRVRQRGKFLECSVVDTGIGIPEEKQHLLFDSFTQMDSSLTRKFGGTGLGLAISKSLVDLMGGVIFVRSRKEKGSVFTFTIPLKGAEKPPAASLAPTLASGRERFSARILLAEDDPLIRDMITLMLAERGWQTETAETGQDAVAKWQRGDFDLVLMDLQMPEMNGVEATRTIREREAGGEKHTSIIGLTAHARRDILDECLSSGMDRVLTKPVQVNDLYSAIDECLK